MKAMVLDPSELELDDGSQAPDPAAQATALEGLVDEVVRVAARFAGTIDAQVVALALLRGALEWHRVQGRERHFWLYVAMLARQKAHEKTRGGEIDAP